MAEHDAKAAGHEQMLSVLGIQIIHHIIRSAVDNQNIEIVLWPAGKQNKWLTGLAYAPRHDCLMMAHTLIELEKLVVSFSKGGIWDRNNNCALNTNDLTGRMRNTFQGIGFVSANKNFDQFALKLEDEGSLCLGKHETIKKMLVYFKKSPVSNKMMEFINNLGRYGSQIKEKPDEEFISQIKKDGGLALRELGIKILNKPPKPVKPPPSFPNFCADPLEK